MNSPALRISRRITGNVTGFTRTLVASNQSLLVFLADERKEFEGSSLANVLDLRLNALELSLTITIAKTQWTFKHEAFISFGNILFIIGPFESFTVELILP